MFIIEICSGSYRRRIPSCWCNFIIQTSVITAPRLLELTAKPQSTIRSTGSL